MITLNVSNMHCGKCVARITDAFNGENIKFEISLENKTVSVEEKDVATAKEILEDLGFDAE